MNEYRTPYGVYTWQTPEKGQPAMATKGTLKTRKKLVIEGNLTLDRYEAPGYEMIAERVRIDDSPIEEWIWDHFLADQSKTEKTEYGQFRIVVKVVDE
jgi:hypothetical protein